VVEVVSADNTVVGSPEAVVSIADWMDTVFVVAVATEMGIVEDNPTLDLVGTGLTAVLVAEAIVAIVLVDSS
jgi:hypothetical protein